MRTRTTILIGALLLVFAGLAQAQQQEQQASSQTTAQAATTPSSTFTPKFGRIDFGFRVDDTTGDEARYSRYRDLRSGGYVGGFRFNRETDTSFFHADAENVGYRDQRFGGQYQSIGKLKAAFNWDQIPLFISGITSSLYTNQGNGVLAIDNSLQQAMQDATALGNAARDVAITNSFKQAKQFDMRSRRDVGTFDLVYTLNRDVDVKFNLKNTNRSGYNLMSFGFGTSPGLNPAVEMGVPTDDRMTDLKGSIEFANTRGLLSFGYNGSWYDNRIPTVTFDNPLRAVDISGGPSSGRAVMWPTNNSFSVNVNGSYKVAPRTKANAAISIGKWNENQPLVSPTVNTALVAPPLERPTAEAKADIVSMVYNLNSRPTENIWLNARYRYYDYANKTPLFEMTQLVGDWSLGTVIWENEPSSLKRHTFDVDASFTPYTFVAFNVGASREDYDRTYRIFEKTAENTFRVSADSTGNQYVTLRAKYEHSVRTGSAFEEALLDEVGEQSETRHYDVANRDRDRTTFTVTLTPVSQFDINGSVSTGRDNYKDTGFGLRDNKNNTWSLGFDVAPIETVTFGLNYGYEKYTALQYSRTANPLSATDTTFNDPTRDWWTDQNDTVKTFTASADFLKAIPKTNIRISYDLSDGNATYVYNMKPEQKVFTTVPLTQLSPLKNKLSDARLDFQYFVRPNLALGVAYWYEDYNVNDFSLNNGVINQLNPANTSTGVFASTIYTGYLYRNYTAHTGWLRLTYLW